MDKKYFIKNTASNYIVLTIRLFLAFFTTPIYLAVYGKPLYGLFILSTSLATSLTFFDFGAGKSLIKYTAEYLVDKNKIKFQSAVNTAISLNIISLCCVLLVCFIIFFNVVSFFRIQPSDIEDAKALFLIAILSTFFTFLDFIPGNILQGAGIFHERNVYQILIVVYNVILIIWVYIFKPSIVAFGLANMVTYALTYFIDFALLRVKGILKDISIKVFLSKQLLNQQSFSYTKEIFLLSLVGFFSSQADKFIIGSIVSVSAVTIYTVITRPYFLLKSLSANMYNVLQPHIVKIKATEGDVTTLIIRVSIIILAIYLFLLGNFIFFGQTFFHLWLRSSEYDQYFFWAVLAVFNWFLTGFYGFIYRTMFVTGETKKILSIDMYAALLNGLLSILFTLWLGFQGVIIGTTVQMIILSVFVYKAGVKLYNVRLNQIFDFNLNILIIFTVILIIIYGYFTQWRFNGNILLGVFEMILFLISFLIFMYHEKIIRKGLFKNKIE